MTFITEEIRQWLIKNEHNDDRERILCHLQNQTGHLTCGWCYKCKGPRFQCNCWVLDSPLKVYFLIDIPV